jgi:hypothetical protein
LITSPHFSPGGPCLIKKWLNSTYLTSLVGGGYTHSDLFGFWNNLASQLERSALKRSYGYAPAADRSTCFASLPQESKSW